MKDILQNIKHEVGYLNKPDPARSEAKRLLANEPTGRMAPPKSRLYKKGGHAMGGQLEKSDGPRHRMPKYQTDEHFPKEMSKASDYRHGGRTRRQCKADGGILMSQPQNQYATSMNSNMAPQSMVMQPQQMQQAQPVMSTQNQNASATQPNQVRSPFKKGGKATNKYSSGSSVRRPLDYDFGLNRSPDVHLGMFGLKKGGKAHKAEGGKMKECNGGEMRAKGGEAMRRGGKAHGRKHYLTGGFLPVVDGIASMFGLKEGGSADGGKMRRGGRSHHAEGGETKATGGSMARPYYNAKGGEMKAKGGETMRRGGHEHRTHRDMGGVLGSMLGHSLGFKEGGNTMKRGGSEFGGLDVQNPYRAKGSVMKELGMSDGGKMAKGGETMRRGGHEHHEHHHKHKYARGGDVYEHEMVGEHPTTKQHHYNYESEMRGVHPVEKSYKEGGMAMGGAGKIRHGQMTPRGKQFTKRVDMDRTRKH